MAEEVEYQGDGDNSEDRLEDDVEDIHLVPLGYHKKEAVAAILAGDRALRRLKKG